MMDGLRIVLFRDLQTFFSNPWVVGFRTFSVIMDTVFFAYIITNVVSPNAVGGFTYLQYYALGALVISVFWASYNIGREVYWDRESGYLNYLMSLPISRGGIVIGRSLGGALRALSTLIPLYIIAMILVPTAGLNVLATIGVLFVFAIGLCGIGITISLSVHQETRARLLNTLFSLVLIRSSTAMYPAVAMPLWLQVGTRLNPVTYASNSVRSTTFDPVRSLAAIDNISIVILFAVLAGSLGSWIFSRIIEGGPAE